jgi:hypothetical protein
LEEVPGRKKRVEGDGLFLKCHRGYPPEASGNGHRDIPKKIGDTFFLLFSGEKFLIIAIYFAFSNPKLAR